MLAGKLVSVLLPFGPFLLHKTHLSSKVRGTKLYIDIKGMGVWLHDTIAYGILYNIGKLQRSFDA